MIRATRAVIGVYATWARTYPWRAGWTVIGTVALILLGLTTAPTPVMRFSPVMLLPVLAGSSTAAMRPALARLPATPMQRWLGGVLAVGMVAFLPAFVLRFAIGRTLDPAQVFTIATLLAVAPLQQGGSGPRDYARTGVWVLLALSGVLLTPAGAATLLVAAGVLDRLPGPIRTADVVDRGGLGVPGRAGVTQAARAASALGALRWIAPLVVVTALVSCVFLRVLNGDDPIRDLRDLRGSVQLSWNATRDLAPAIVVVLGPALGALLGATLGVAGSTGPAPGAVAASRLPVPPRALVVAMLARSGLVWATGILGAIVAALGVQALGIELPAPWIGQFAAGGAVGLALVIAAQLGRGVAPLLPPAEARISWGLTVALLILASIALPGIAVASRFGGGMIVGVVASTALLSTSAWAAWCVRSVG